MSASGTIALGCGGTRAQGTYRPQQRGVRQVYVDTASSARPDGPATPTARTETGTVPVQQQSQPALAGRRLVCPSAPSRREDTASETRVRNSHNTGGPLRTHTVVGKCVC